MNAAAHDAALLAITRILAAGNTGRTDGTPFPGALDKLIRIHREMSPPTLPLGAVVLFDLTAMPGRERALAYLRDVAISVDATSATAVMALESEYRYGGAAGNPPGQRAEALAILRELYDRKLVKSPMALSELNRIAAWQKWPRRLPSSFDLPPYEDGLMRSLGPPPPECHARHSGERHIGVADLLLRS
jgi:hypothetical protein